MAASKEENVKVYLRIRPSKCEEQARPKCKIQLENKKSIILEKSGTSKRFTFNQIFDESSTQLDLYRKIAVPIVNRVFEGYNGTIFAYGQSGTGKTYTMMGEINEPEEKGIIPNIFSQIFTQISLANKEVSYAVTVTYLEIYNEEVRDLLSQSSLKKLPVFETPGEGICVRNLKSFNVTSLKLILEILQVGNKNRVVGSTKINAVSSRSHAVFTVHVETKNKITNKLTYGKLNLVDLAGSERVSKTLSTGDRLKEAGKINYSLSVLGNVISALVEGKPHIPYRSSKLTRLLKDSLGGNSLSAMIAMISPNLCDTEENLYTLMYADKVKHIQNCVKINTDQKSIINTLEQQIAKLKNQLEMLNCEHENERRKEVRKSKGSICEGELSIIEEKKCILVNKIHTIEGKILIGGENMIEKAQLQLKLLNDSSMELQNLDDSQLLLRESLLSIETENNIIEQECANLEKENKELDKKIEKLEHIISKATTVREAKKNGYQDNIKSLFFTNKVLSREMSLVHFTAKSYIPQEEIKKVSRNIIWNKNIQDWQINSIAYSGNNFKQQKNEKTTKIQIIATTQNVYKNYQKRGQNV